MSLEHRVGLQLIPATHIIFFLIKVTVQRITSVHYTVYIAYNTLCIYLHWHSFCFILRFCLFGHSLSSSLVIDFFQLLPLLWIILIPEMYSRYFRSHNQQLHGEPINIIHHKIRARFWLYIGFLKAYCHQSREPRYIRNQILWLGLKWVADYVLFSG
jgi:hypothetical protein